MADPKIAAWRQAQDEEAEFRKASKGLLGKAMATREGYAPFVRGDRQAQEKTYDTMQNMREENVEVAAKRAGVKGDPYDRRYVVEREAMPTAAQLKELQRQREERMRRKAEDAAPTTANQMGKRFAQGGAVRGDGCIRKGHTKGRMV